MDHVSNDVRSLSTDEGREAGTIGHEKAREHIVERLRQIGVQQYFGDWFELPYVRGEEGFVNIIGRIPGRPCVVEYQEIGHSVKIVEICRSPYFVVDRTRFVESVRHEFSVRISLEPYPPWVV